MSYFEAIGGLIDGGVGGCPPGTFYYDKQCRPKQTASVGAPPTTTAVPFVASTTAAAPTVAKEEEKPKSWLLPVGLIAGAGLLYFLFRKRSA